MVIYLFNKYTSNFQHPFSVLRVFLYYYSTFDWENYAICIEGPVPIQLVNSYEEKLMYLKSISCINRFEEVVTYIQSTINPQQQHTTTANNYNNTTTNNNNNNTNTNNNNNNTNTFAIRALNIIDPVDSNNNLGYSVSKSNVYLMKDSMCRASSYLETLMTQHPSMCMNSGYYNSNGSVYQPDQNAAYSSVPHIPQHFPTYPAGQQVYTPIVVPINSGAHTPYTHGMVPPSPSYSTTGHPSTPHHSHSFFPPGYQQPINQYYGECCPPIPFNPHANQITRGSGSTNESVIQMPSSYASHASSSHNHSPHPSPYSSFNSSMLQHNTNKSQSARTLTPHIEGTRSRTHSDSLIRIKKPPTIQHLIATSTGSAFPSPLPIPVPPSPGSLSRPITRQKPHSNHNKNINKLKTMWDKGLFALSEVESRELKHKTMMECMTNTHSNATQASMIATTVETVSRHNSAPIEITHTIATATSTTTSIELDIAPDNNDSYLNTNSNNNNSMLRPPSGLSNATTTPPQSSKSSLMVENSLSLATDPPSVFLPSTNTSTNDLTVLRDSVNEGNTKLPLVNSASNVLKKPIPKKPSFALSHPGSEVEAGVASMSHQPSPALSRAQSYHSNLHRPMQPASASPAQYWFLSVFFPNSWKAYMTDLRADLRNHPMQQGATTVYNVGYAATVASSARQLSDSPDGRQTRFNLVASSVPNTPGMRSRRQTEALDDSFVLPPYTTNPFDGDLEGMKASLTTLVHHLNHSSPPRERPTSTEPTDWIPLHKLNRAEGTGMLFNLDVSGMTGPKRVNIDGDMSDISQSPKCMSPVQSGRKKIETVPQEVTLSSDKVHDAATGVNVASAGNSLHSTSQHDHAVRISGSPPSPVSARGNTTTTPPTLHLPIQVGPESPTEEVQRSSPSSSCKAIKHVPIDPAAINLLELQQEEGEAEAVAKVLRVDLQGKEATQASQSVLQPQEALKDEVGDDDDLPALTLAPSSSSKKRQDNNTPDYSNNTSDKIVHAVSSESSKANIDLLLLTTLANTTLIHPLSGGGDSCEDLTKSQLKRRKKKQTKISTTTDSPEHPNTISATVTTSTITTYITTVPETEGCEKEEEATDKNDITLFPIHTKQPTIKQHVYTARPLPFHILFRTLAALGISVVFLCFILTRHHVLSTTVTHPPLLNSMIMNGSGGGGSNRSNISSQESGSPSGL